VTWTAIGTDMDTSRRNRVRYDSPTFMGFTASTSWGEDDEWDVALRYANEWNGLRVAAGIAYMEDADDNGGIAGFCNVASPSSNNGSPGNGPACFERETYGGSIAFLHVPSGVHVEGGYAHRENNVDEAWSSIGVDINAVAAANGLQFDDESEHWWVGAGIQFRMNSLGKTDFSVGYIENENVGNIDFNNVFGAALSGIVADGAGFGGFDYTSYQVGVTQDVDAIGAVFYLSYIRHEADYTDTATANAGVLGLQTQIDADFDQVNAGARFKF